MNNRFFLELVRNNDTEAPITIRLHFYDLGLKKTPYGFLPKKLNFPIANHSLKERAIIY